MLGTASQAPTRYRNHNGYLLRWDGYGVLFDPGEGTQRQLLLAGLAVSAIDLICVTHFHGDHCLGLPGVLARRSLDQVSHAAVVCFPAESRVHFDRLRYGPIGRDDAPLDVVPVEGDGLVLPGPPLALAAARLAHGPPTFGWRLQEPDGRRMVVERLEAAGIRGTAVGELQRAGELTVAGRRIRLEDVSVARRGQSVAFVMDTGWCDAALELADGVDLLVCEATFAEADADLARRFGHLTAAQAGRIAGEARVRRLVITHFSQRYPDVTPLLAEARRGAERAGGEVDVVAAADLLHVDVPPRPRGLGTG